MMNIGNDELILHIRKNYKNCQISNAQLGKLINEWITKNITEARIIEHKKPCYWNDLQSDLPKTSAEYGFPKKDLSALYNQLDVIANTNK